MEDGDEETTGEEVPSLAPGPREGQREAVQARALLEKAERLIERVQAEDKPEVQRLMEKVRTTLTDRSNADSTPTSWMNSERSSTYAVGTCSESVS